MNLLKVKTCKRIASYLWYRKKLNKAQKKKIRSIKKKRVSAQLLSKISEHAHQLEQKRKVLSIYGKISIESLKKYKSEALAFVGQKNLKKDPLAKAISVATNDNFLKLLEMRLDSTIFKGGLSPTIKKARQLISHRHVLVNNKKIASSSKLLPGDIIDINLKRPVDSKMAQRCALRRKYSGQSPRRPKLPPITERPGPSIHGIQARWHWVKDRNLNIGAAQAAFDPPIKQDTSWRTLPAQRPGVGPRRSDGRTRSPILRSFRYHRARIRRRKRKVKRTHFVRMKPKHLEISYALNKAIVLFLPTQILYPTKIDVESVFKFLG